MQWKRWVAGIGFCLVLAACGHNPEAEDRAKDERDEAKDESFWCHFYGNCEGHSSPTCDVYGTCEKEVSKMCSFYGNCDDGASSSVSSGCSVYGTCGSGGGAGIHGPDTPDSSPGDVGF